MDSINFDNVKAEKAKALRRYNRFRRIGRLFRAAEVCVAVVFILWTFTRLPFAVQISREFLHRIAGVISTPLFVFILGNCIVVALLAKSSVEEENRGSSSSSNAETKIYEALVRSKPSDEEEEEEEEEIVYDDKEVIVLTEDDSSTNIIPHASLVDTCEPKEYGRSKSDGVCLKQSNSADDDHHMVLIPKPSSSLHRSETEKCIRTHDDINKSWEDNYAEDNLSNEDFQKTIEAFIAKQLMFRRQESLALVLHHNKP